MRHLKVCLQLVKLPGVFQRGDQANNNQSEVSIVTVNRSVLPDCEPRGLAGVLQTQSLDLRRSVQQPLLQSFIWLDPNHFNFKVYRTCEQ